ncbi:hypothetical protein KP509_39G016700 [Ceratopteris richardii]|uniref:DUF962 domain-containing protein n=1 Tax=Ceratopteris richardii TaxID=49495 RepID=A0A8T2PZ22_CERRI|nr:hypothetical protein KP509_39G016700 [Ceratopteris richardii]
MSVAREQELQFHNIQQFWEFYVTQHSKAPTRWWHFAGTASAVLLLFTAIASAAWWLVPLGIVLGYACAWYSHFFIEGNKPATFGHPLWSFACDWRMFALMLGGKMDAEVSRIVKSRR